MQYSDQVEDTKFVNNDIFLTVGGDGNLAIWDLRAKQVQQRVAVSNKELYCLDVNPQNNNLVLTGGEEGVVKLWDARNYSSKLYNF